jgi:glycosyltransferase involved in cell wall biosynthesis
LRKSVLRIVYLATKDVPGGGHRVLFEHANHLVARGHEVLVISLAPPPKWFPLKADFRRVCKFEGNIPKAEVVVSSCTLDSFAASEIRFGVPFYLIQGPEAIYALQSELFDTKRHIKKCVDSYRLPLRILCVSTWMRNYFWHNFYRDAVVVPNGIDTTHFYPKGKKEKEKLRILYSFNPFFLKGAIYGLRALKIVKDRYPDIEIVMFGLVERPNFESALGFSFPFTYFKDPTQDELVSLYSSCDIFLFSSLLESFNLTVLEAMACGCAVVTTDCVGIRDYVKHSQNALVSPPQDHETLADQVCCLVRDEVLRAKLSREGVKTAKNHSWSKTIDLLEEIFFEAKQVSDSLKDDRLSLWERIVRISPGDPWAHYQFGRSLIEVGDIERAKEEFELAISLNRKFPAPYRELAMIYKREGDPRRSLFFLKRAQKLIKNSTSG